MDILLAIFVVVMPSALAAAWLAWHSGNFDFTKQRWPNDRAKWVARYARLPNSDHVTCHPKQGAAHATVRTPPKLRATIVASDERLASAAARSGFDVRNRIDGGFKRERLVVYVIDSRGRIH